MVKCLRGPPRDRLAGRPAGRPRKTAPQASPVATLALAKASERPSEDASERRSAKVQDLTLPIVPHVIPDPCAADTENEPSSASGPMDTDHGGARLDPARDDPAQVRSTTPAPGSPDDRTNQVRKRNVRPASQSEQSESNVSSGVKRDARAAELLDEDEQGSKFQQVEGLTTVDAEEILCEVSVGDDFEVDEAAEGVDEEQVMAIMVGEKKELDTMEAFGTVDVFVKSSDTKGTRCRRVTQNGRCSKQPQIAEAVRVVAAKEAEERKHEMKVESCDREEQIAHNKESRATSNRRPYAREYVAKVEVEFQKICDGILALTDKNLIPSDRRMTDQSKVRKEKACTQKVINQGRPRGHPV